MAQDTGMPDIQVDRHGLYREEVFTDRKAGTLRRLLPVTAEGAADSSRPVLYSGQTQLLTPGGVLPLSFEIEATTLDEALTRFPAAVHDCVAATRWVFAQAAALRFDAERIAVGGDSAGANLATVTSLILRDSGAPMPRFQLLFYPGTDLSQFTTPSHIELANGYLLTRDVMVYFRANYVREEDWRDWRASPIFANSLAGLPSAYLMTAGFDPLRDEGKAYADAMSAAGVPVEYECYDGMIHGFITMGGAITKANDAVTRAAAVLRRALA